MLGRKRNQLDRVKTVKAIPPVRIKTGKPQPVKHWPFNGGKRQ